MPRRSTQQHDNADDDVAAAVPASAAAVAADGAYPHVRTVSVQPSTSSSSTRRQYTEPLLAGHPDDVVTPLRHTTSSYVVGATSGHGTTTAAALLSPSTSLGGGDGFEISYDVANPNYLVNQHHSLNDDFTDAEQFGRSQSHISGPFTTSITEALTPSGDSFQYVLYPQRWWIVFVFCFISINQSLIWVGAS